MARVDGVDPQQTSFLMRQVFKKVRKKLGRDLTPQKITARVPRVFGLSTSPSGCLVRKPKSPSGSGRSSCCGLRRASAVPFESTPILPAAECSA
jgi:hypothetical protein